MKSDYLGDHFKLNFLCQGLLWVGTNVGIALTIPLPRLEGVPIISGKTNISFHAHFGPVRMFLPITQKVIIKWTKDIPGK